MKATATKPPAGLCLFLSLLQEGNENEAIYTQARKALANMEEMRHGGFAIETEKAVAAIFPGVTEPPTDGTIFETGFLIGAATAWMLMTSLNGGAR